ncbi:MAG TPA: dihydroorotate dehydrogenase [Candidatus Fimenecus excrementigallinarum]|uniref:Dihydroorotate dehydrogenase n=1 Tax=Candidatus Fimenecus excrementigallinarum TaxID=2840816 RepID=A0A9D1LED7_9FIRM|nr:dihydroorotate dehydrogenase [Candidatus Fimenecus excrementigallinarum]
MADLHVDLCGVRLKNPVITASGTFGFGQEYARLYDIQKLGGISCKGTTLHERPGNLPPRIAETPSGMLNSVGLQNPGVDAFLKDDLPALEKLDLAVLANVAGSTEDEYVETIRRLQGSAVDIIEVNISCPNVKAGGVSFGTDPSAVERITRLCKAASDKPIMMKLSPNVTDIAEIAAAAEAGGADAVSLINTLTGMRIDIRTRRPILRNNTGGLSGAAVFPVALRMVWQVANRVQIPVVGMGGITRWQDAAEMLLAGASAVQIGAANFTDAFTPLHIIEGLNAYLDENGLASVSELVGQVRPW